MTEDKYITFTADQIERYSLALKKAVDGDEPDDDALYDLKDHLKFGSAPTGEKLPCPFCGCTEIETDRNDDDDLFWCKCTRCNTLGPEGDTPTQSIHFWNERGGKPHEDTT